MAQWSEVAALAELQHRTVATWQLVLLGVSEGALADRLAHHGWRRWSRGIYLLPGEITPVRRLAASMLAYSGPVGVQQRVNDHRREHPAMGAVRRRQGLPLVDVEQALIDIAGADYENPRHLYHRLTRLIASADALRRTSLDAVEERIAMSANFRGRRALLDACRDLRGQLTHSDAEAAARKIVARVLGPFGLGLEPRPHPVRLGGRIVGEADLAVVAIMFDLEVDGPHHLLPAQRAPDDDRDRLVRRAGWTVERYSTELIDLSPRTFEARVADTVGHLVARTSRTS